MIDFETPSSLKAIDALREGRTRAILLRYACWFTRSEAHAEDLLQDALLSICDPESRPWDDARASFMTHARLVMRDIAREARDNGYGRYIVLDSTVTDVVPTPSPTPDEALSNAEELARLHHLGAILRERLVPDDLALRVFDLACEGIDRPAEVAVSLRQPVDAIYKANERIAYHANRVLAEEAASRRVQAGARPVGATLQKDQRP